jgi:diguanylate cyclase (GGDEF)-like protein
VVDAPQSAAPGAPRRGSRVWLGTYLATQSTLLVAAGIANDPARAILQYVMLAGGTVVFTAAVIIRRPSPAVGWLVLVAASWAVIACATATAVTYGLGAHASVKSVVPVILAAVPLPVFGLGLGLLSHSVARSGPVDGLDAAMTCLCGFLLVWSFAIEPVFVQSARAIAVAIVIPVGALFVVSLAVRIALGGGLRDPATAVLLGATGLLVALALLKIIPTLGSGTFRESIATSFVSAAYGVVLGCIGLLPSFPKPRHPPGAATTDLTGQRLALFVFLALVPLVAWGQQSQRHAATTSMVARQVPIAASAAFLALLIARLSMLARLAQRRSNALAFQAAHDPLTGLANRSALTTYLELSGTEADTTGTLLMLDIDNFKSINDVRGHQAGDALLVDVARRLQSAAPPGAMVARLGGDEFVVLARDTNEAAARALAERVVDLFRSPYRVGDDEVTVTTSIGVVTMPERGTSAYDRALRDADLALYDAKSAGKNQYVMR